MVYERDESLAQLVVDAHAATRTTFEVARQLSELLPIESREDFMQRGRLSLAGEEVPVSAFEPVLPEELFPISDQRELVEKVTAAVRVAGQMLQQHAPSHVSERLSHLIDELVREAGGRPAVAYFGGPSLFGGSERTAEAS